MKDSIKIILLLIVCLLISDTLEAQSRKKRSRKKEEAKEASDAMPFTEKLNTEIKLGNLSFSNGFGIALKSNVGYKFTKALSAGLGGKLAYNTISQFGPDLTAFDYAGFVYGRVKLGEVFYVQGEYNLYSLENFGGDRTSFKYPTIGIGYMQNDGGNWAYGVELLYIANDAFRDQVGEVVEYWINFSHRF
jgi:hypothetical protein